VTHVKKSPPHPGRLMLHYSSDCGAGSIKRRPYGLERDTSLCAPAGFCNKSSLTRRAPHPSNATVTSFEARRQVGSPARSSTTHVLAGCVGQTCSCVRDGDQSPTCAGGLRAAEDWIRGVTALGSLLLPTFGALTSRRIPSSVYAASEEVVLRWSLAVGGSTSSKSVSDGHASSAAVSDTDTNEGEDSIQVA
jgi:hypothetical protein